MAFRFDISFSFSDCRDSCLADSFCASFSITAEGRCRTNSRNCTWYADVGWRTVGLNSLHFDEGTGEVSRDTDVKRVTVAFPLLVSGQNGTLFRGLARLCEKLGSISSRVTIDLMIVLLPNVSLPPNLRSHCSSSALGARLRMRVIILPRELLDAVHLELIASSLLDESISDVSKPPTEMVWDIILARSPLDGVVIFLEMLQVHRIGALVEAVDTMVHDQNLDGMILDGLGVAIRSQILYELGGVSASIRRTHRADWREGISALLACSTFLSCSEVLVDAHGPGVASTSGFGFQSWHLPEAQSWPRCFVSSDEAAVQDPFIGNVLFINLKRSRMRQLDMLRQLHCAGVDVWRIVAVEGSHALNHDPRLIQLIAARGITLSHLNDNADGHGAVGCTLSHDIAWRLAGLLPGNAQLILEDDAVLVEGWKSLVRNILSELASVDWDVCFLYTFCFGRSCRFDGRPWRGNRVSPNLVKLGPAVDDGRNLGTTAYLLNTRGKGLARKVDVLARIPIRNTDGVFNLAQDDIKMYLATTSDTLDGDDFVVHPSGSPTTRSADSLT